MILENPSNSTTDRFFSVWWALLFVKLFAGALFPLSADEAYYWTWSHHLDWSYFDHPPMVAWLLALGRPFEIFGQAVRWPAILLGHLIPLMWWVVLKNHLSSKQIFYWLLLFSLCPMTGLGGVVVTPDLPLLFFWSLSVLFFYRLLEFPSAKNAVLLGLALGLGFCSKYHIVLLPLSLLPLIFSKEIRLKFPWRFLPITILAGLLGCFPVLYWNYQHDFISFAFQIRHGLADPAFEIRWPLEYLAGEFLLLFPPIVWLAFAGPQLRDKKILLATALVPLGFFFFTSFKASTELNWPLMAYPSVFALAAANLGKKTLWSAGAFWGVVQVIAAAALLFPAQWPLHGKLTEPEKIRSLTPLVEGELPLFTTTYQLASSLWYNSKKPVYKVSGTNRFDMFDLWPESQPTKKFRLLAETDQDLPQNLVQNGWTFVRLTPPAPGFELYEMSPP